jgi:DnaK suppressor protein
MLESHEQDGYRKRLADERVKILAELEKNDVPEDFGSDVDDASGIEANEAEQYQNQLSVSEALRTRLNEIDEALESIEAGTYGICTSCGKDISKSVLDAAPESRLCADCKQKKTS